MDVSYSIRFQNQYGLSWYTRDICWGSKLNRRKDFSGLSKVNHG